MDNSFIDYDTLVRISLVGVFKQALSIVEKEGMPSEHMMYVSFKTNHKDVILPDYIKKKYPEDMVILIENQFWNLKVADSYFKVDLYFDNIETILVPFSAVTHFSDPYAKFGIKFDNEDMPEEDLFLELESILEESKEEKKLKEKKDTKVEVIDLDRFRKDKK